MDRQAVFNTISQHLLTQKRKSLGRDDNICRYRGESGRKCAIGVLIKDEFYSQAFDVFGYTVQDTTVREALALSLGVNISALDTVFLMTLQRLHDMHETDTWTASLKDFAERNNLNCDVLNEFNSATP